MKPYENLATAIIVQAIIHARHDRRKQEPKEWLLSDGCRFYCEALGIDHDLIVKWVDIGCPGQVRSISLSHLLGRSEIQKRNATVGG